MSTGPGIGNEAVKALAERLYVELVSRTVKTGKIADMNPSPQDLLKLSYGLAMEFHSAYANVEASAAPTKQKYEFQMSDVTKSK